MLLLGSEELKLNSWQAGRHAHVAAAGCSAVLRSKIDRCSQPRRENWAASALVRRPHVARGCLLESLAHLHDGCDGDRADRRLRKLILEWKVEEYKMLLVIRREQMRFLGLPRSDS